MRRKGLRAALPALMTLASLFVGTACWSGTERIELRQAGFRLEEAAFVVPLRDGRDTVELIVSQAAEIAALREFLAAQNASVERIAEEFGALEAAVEAERAAWRAEAERLAARNRRLASPWAVGFFGGFDPFRREAVCGVGVVFSVVRF